MPVNWLSEADRERLIHFPTEVSYSDLIAFFTLTKQDLKFIRRRHRKASWLGSALQFCAQRYLGFVPVDLKRVPSYVLSFLARQLDVEVGVIHDYSNRGHTRSDHVREIQSYLGFSKATSAEWAIIEKWLADRALEHDRPLLLLNLLCERLHLSKFIRPGLSILERIVSTARQNAQEQTWRLMQPVLNSENRVKLDSLLIVDPQYNVTPLTMFRTGATSHSPAAILNVLGKVSDLRQLGIVEWDLSDLNPNRLKLLAQIGRKATNQSLERMSAQRRYPILLAFLQRTLTEATDEAVDLFDRYLSEAYSRAGRELDELR
ncbi:MAG: DUF4158 domain-containing protein, partial [Blastocatellia bacterium]